MQFCIHTLGDRMRSLGRFKPKSSNHVNSFHKKDLYPPTILSSRLGVEFESVDKDRGD